MRQMLTRSTRRTASVFVAVAVATLAGCAHTNDVLAQRPEEVFHSAQSQSEVAACFEKLDHLRVIDREDGAKVARLRNGYGGDAETTSIYTEGSGSRIELRSNAIGVPEIRWKTCVGLKPVRS